jgi:predicted lipid carrier protein YhbT
VPSEIEFVEGILSLCLTLATTKAGADALLFGQRIDVPGGVVCSTPMVDITAARG